MRLQVLVTIKKTSVTSGVMLLRPGFVVFLFSHCYLDGLIDLFDSQVCSDLSILLISATWTRILLHMTMQPLWEEYHEARAEQHAARGDRDFLDRHQTPVISHKARNVFGYLELVAMCILSLSICNNE